MNYSQALECIDNEKSMQSGPTYDAMDLAYNILANNSSTQPQKEMAVGILDAVFGDTTVLFADFNEFAQAVCCVSLTVNPNSPPRPTTHR